MTRAPDAAGSPSLVAKTRAAGTPRDTSLRATKPGRNSAPRLRLTQHVLDQPLMTTPTLITNIRMVTGWIAKPPQLIVINPGAASVTVPLIGKIAAVFE